MKSFLAILLIGCCILLSCALPVTKPKKDEEQQVPSTSESPDAIEYKRYLNEVVEALESDQDFRRKLEKSSEADIRSGKIAQELDYVNHHVRSKLDEIKRRELERLRHLASKKFEMENEIDRDHLKISQHLDHGNAQSFEIEDLKKLIKKTVADLTEADRKRESEFKEYEMQKEFEKQMVKGALDEEQQKKFEEEQNQLKETHKKHEKVHHPGNKAQLEDVWEKQDHMDKRDFDPRTFFVMHDVDGNGFWDETEVKALFIKELDKVYKAGAPEVDMRERAEEMERMREHVFKETDTNKDDLISFEEFMEQTKRDEYNRDPEWQTIEEQPQYTHEEYLEFERRRREEVDRMIAQGLLPPHPNMPQGYYANDPNAAYQTGQHQPPNYQQNPQMHYQDPQQQHLQQQQQYHQQQQQYYQQQQYHPQPQYQNQQQQQKQYQEQQVHLNSNQIYQQIPIQQQQQPLQQQPQPDVNSLPPQQQQQQPIVNNAIPEKPVASNTAFQQQSVPNNIPSQQQPPVSNNLPQQQQPINNVAPQQPVKNVQPQQNIPQKR